MNSLYNTHHHTLPYKLFTTLYLDIHNFIICLSHIFFYNLYLNFIIYFDISLEFQYILFSLNSEIYNFIHIHNYYKYLMLGYIILYINTFVISFYYNNYQISYFKKSTRKKEVILHLLCVTMNINYELDSSHS